MKKYKTVIIGGGPAGLRCAQILAENKEDHILLEAKSGIYRKICTGMYGVVGSELNGRNYFPLPEEIFQKKFNKVILHLKNRKKEVADVQPFVATLDRRKLNQWMYDEAVKSGANMAFNSTVTEIGENYVSTDGEKMFFDYLVGADGSNSVVRRKLGLSMVGMLAIQYWVERDWPNMEIFLDYFKYGPWYAWLAPHGGKFSIGTGADTDTIKAEKIKSNLDNLCDKLKIPRDKNDLEGAFINHSYEGYKFGNIFLAGDAAGLSSGLTGEGIYFALVSGEDVAKMIIDSSYNPVSINKILKKRKRHEFFVKILKNKILGPLALRLAFALLSFNAFKVKAIRFIS